MPLTAFDHANIRTANLDAMVAWGDVDVIEARNADEETLMRAAYGLATREVAM